MKYLRLLGVFFRVGFIADLEYRANFVTRVATDVFWYLAQIVCFETLFLHTESIGQWNVEQMRVFLGILFVVDAMYMILFSDNFDQFSEKIRKGELDLLLAKPVNSQFMISFQKISTSLIGNLLIGFGWLCWSLAHLPDFQWTRLFWLMLLVPCGLACLYTVRFLFACMALLFTRAENLQYLFYQVYKLGLRPDKIYFPWLKFLLLTVFPVGVVASVPARAILDSPNYGLFTWVLIWSLTLLYLSGKVWRFCLKFYSSASS